MLDPTKYDAHGLPWRGSLRRDSPHYVPKDGIDILLNGRRYVQAGIIEFDRVEGWLLVMPWGRDGTPHRTYGRVELLWHPDPHRLVTPIPV